ncbi:hypothetical protein [Natrarchaeobius oligotrophus]|uniref:hypothetical protein n=1 Tax=Natrarchaeobius oligotrophus TaxID=3455743 RepID=UPI000F52C111|nr:hypothetical protein [Natrarchaeobius chitinivorans]
MVAPAKTRDGDIHCSNCLQSMVGGEIEAELVKDNGDVRAYSLECPDCGATGSYINKLGFNPDEAIDEPFTKDW